MLITSAQNPQLKFLRTLHQKRKRDEFQKFLVEGIDEHRRLLDSSFQIEACWYCSEIVTENTDSASILDSLRQREGVDLVELSTTAFSKLAYREKSGGLVSVVSQPPSRLDTLKVPENGLFLIAQGIEKPGNLGSMFRSGDAVGVDGIVVCDSVTDVFNPNTIRASIGTIFSVPFAVTKLDSLLKWMQRHSIELVGASPAAITPYAKYDFTKKCAILVGGEHGGIPPAVLDNTDAQLSLPTKGQGNSINAAMAATVLVFEARRQRDTTA